MYIPCLGKDEKTNAEAIAKMLLHNMWQRHGLPLSVALNQGFQFIAAVWKSLCKVLMINAKLKPKMERHLRTYVNHFQDNWFDFLPTAKFAANANISSTTKILLFQATRK